MSSDPKDRPPRKLSEDEASDGKSADPLTDEDIETEDIPRARMQAKYDGDGSQDLSIHDD